MKYELFRHATAYQQLSCFSQDKRYHAAAHMRLLDSALAIMTVFQTITRHYNRGGNGCLEQLAPIIHRFGAFRAAYVRAFDNEGEGFWSELITSEGVCAKFWQFLASRSGEFWAEHVNVGVQSIVEDAQKQDPKCLEDFLVANASTLRLEVKTAYPKAA